MKTNPNSFVALLAVDQRVSFIKRGNDIDLLRATAETNSFYSALSNETKNRNIYSLLGESNAFILTDALSGKPSCSQKPRVIRAIKSHDEDNHDSENEVLPARIAETWIFKSFGVDSRGEHVLTEKVPDAFTSYIISGFSINPELGLGVAEPKKLSAFKQFFVELDLPQTILVGEVLKVKAFVYNFMANSRVLNSEVTLVNDEKNFEILNAVSVGRSCSYKPSQQNSKTVQATSGVATEVNFFIRPLKKGLLKVKVVVDSGTARDEDTKDISVKLQKLEESKTNVKFLDLRSRRYDSYYFDMTAEEGALQSSIQTEVSVIGDLIGPALENINNLL